MFWIGVLQGSKNDGPVAAVCHFAGRGNDSIWYFYWNMPFGDITDFTMYDRRFADEVRNHVALMNNKWNSLDHSKQIQPIPIHNMLIKCYNLYLYLYLLV